jgi:hypothetical protein
MFLGVMGVKVWQKIQGRNDYCMKSHKNMLLSELNLYTVGMWSGVM